MKKYLFCLSMFAALSAVRVFADDTNKIEWGAITNNVQTSISLKDGPATIKTNQPFSLLARIRNVSTNHTFSFCLPFPPEYESGLKWVVISPSGRDVSPVPKLVLRVSNAIVLMNPNQIYEFEFKLSSICKFGESGIYKIVAKMDISWSPHEPCWVVSNPLYLTVVSGEWKAEITNAPPNGF